MYRHNSFYLFMYFMIACLFKVNLIIVTKCIDINEQLRNENKENIVKLLPLLHKYIMSYSMSTMALYATNSFME